MYLRIFGEIKLNSGLFFLLKYLKSISRLFYKAPFVGNPSFNTNSLSAWATAYLSGPKVPMKLRSCNHPVRKTNRKQRVVTQWKKF